MRKTILALALGLTATSAVAADFKMFRHPGCGCCLAWVKHLKDAGHEVEIRNTEMMAEVKAKVGVPRSAYSCHTAIVEGYVIEGHVPAADIERLLAEKPDAIGLAVPGMPMGSPGMEHGDHVQPYEVLLMKKDGTTTTWSRHG